MSDPKELVRAARERGMLEGEIQALEDVINQIDYACDCDSDLASLREFADRQIELNDAKLRAINAAECRQANTDYWAAEAARDAEIKAERDAALDEQEPLDVDRPANPITGNRSVSEGWQG